MDPQIQSPFFCFPSVFHSFLCTYSVQGLLLAQLPSDATHHLPQRAAPLILRRTVFSWPLGH